MKKTIPLFLFTIILLLSFGVIAQVNLSNGLVASYSFDGNANDLSGLGNNGTVSGATLAQDRFGNPNSSYSFNGVDQSISIGNNSSLKMQNGLSISVWIKPVTIPISGLYNIISDHAPGEAVDGSGKVLRFAGSEIQFIVYGVYAFGNAIYARYTFPTSEGNKWHHIVGTYDGSVVKLYINGVLVDQISNNLPIAVNNNPLLVGKSGYGEYFNGEMDDLRIYNRGLTSDEVSALYNISGEVKLNEGLIAYYPFNGNLNDYSNNKNHITTVIGTQFANNRYGAGLSALSFAGGSNRVLAPSSPSLNSVTNGLSFSLWIKQTSANCATCSERIPNYGYRIISKDPFGALEGGYSLDARGYNGSSSVTGRKMRLSAASGTTVSNSTDTEDSQSYTLNNWHHLVATYDLNTVKYYLDNVLTTSLTSAIASIGGNNFNLSIGGPSDDQWTGMGFNYKGLIDEVRIYNRAINANEINALYNSYEIETPVVCRPTTITSIVQVPSSKFGFYTIDKSTMDLVFVDTLGTISFIGNTGIQGSFKGIIGSLEFDKFGTLWYSSVNDSLFTINTTSGKATYITKIQHPYINVTNGIYYNAISFNSKNEMYAWIEPIGPDLGQLVKVTNIQLGTTTTLSGGQSSDLPEVNAIEFGKNDTLWALDQCCYRKLHMLSTVSGLSITKSTITTNRVNVNDMDYSNGSIYGLNLPGYQSGTTTGFFKVDKSGNATSLFSLPGQYLGLAGQVRKMYPDTVYITKHDTVLVTKVQTVTVISFVTVTGLNTGNENEGSDIQAYPNPTTNKLSVTSESGSVYSIELIDSKGTVILTSLTPNSIDVGDKAKGIYLLKAKGYNGVVLKTFKVIIE